eukprot:TRINITY_DN3995_c0_g1_i2.p1 TRINITY_DN3995_c0_g1~~TRINITY_DN3995_c0_g1_i2.p1  ORF type:complete len:588 (-),score=191.64 TRINITY_DN3995_c0_g1_i2:23-1786(-)
MCIRERYQRRVRDAGTQSMGAKRGLEESEEEEEEEEMVESEEDLLEEDVSDGEIDEHDSLDEEDEDDEESEDEGVVDDDDSSDDETMVNTVGNVPMRWYEGEDHIGYDREGNKIARPATVDQIQDFVNKADDPDYWRSVFDELNQKNVVLTDEELKTITRIRSGGFAHSDKFDPFIMPATMVVDPQEQAMPISAAPKPKSSFIPSKWEAMRVRKMVKAIREGRFTKRAAPPPAAQNYLIWDDDMSEHRTRRGGAELLSKQHIPAPKPVLPGHGESYNPSQEYLPTEQERTEWENLDPEEREAAWIPTKFNSLREVPAYQEFIREAFNRCLDLYLCPRVRRMRHNISSDALIPKLPNPKELEPFPKMLCTLYLGHTHRIRSISFSKSGEYFASASDDCTIKIWEVDSGRCIRTVQIPDGNKCTMVCWCPSDKIHLLLAVVKESVWLLDPGTGGSQNENAPLPGSDVPCETEDVATWSKPSSHLAAEVPSLRTVLKLKANVKHVSWHTKGDYLSTVTPDAAGMPVAVHSLSKRQSRVILKKARGAKVQQAMFHPTKAYFLSLIHISEPTRLLSISYAVFCLKKKKKNRH